MQFGYVAQGMPDWVAEGTANTLAFFFTNVDHPVILHQADMWLRNPGRPLWYPGFSCDRCYGGIWWWAIYRTLLRSYFERLATFAQEPEGDGLGVPALEATFQDARPELGRFVTPALYLDFAYSFAPALPQAAYPRSIRPPPAAYSVTARARAQSVQRALPPLSVRFVALKVAGRARSFEVSARSREGPNPIITLLLGLRQRPGKRALLRRSVSPCFATFLPGYATMDHRIAVDIRSRLERTSDLLVVANPSNKTIRYTLAYASSSRRARLPSPTEQDEVGPNTFCKKLRVDRQGIDPTGDAEGGLAPDIGELNISATKVLASGDHLVTFVVDLANRTELGRGDTVTVWVDADRQAATGCAPIGAEYALVVRGQPGPDAYRLGRCVNGAFTFAGAQGRFIARFEGTFRRTLLLMTESRDIGGAIFDFKVDAAWRDGSGQEHHDSAPDTGVYCFCGSRSSRTSPKMTPSTHSSLRQ